MTTEYKKVYSAIDYMNAKLSIPELESRFKAYEPLVRVAQREYSNIERAMQNFEFGQQLLKELRQELDEYRQCMENLVLVIELKKSGEI